MFQKLICLIIMCFPLSVFAENNYEVTSHLIDAEIEIAGALRVKELIIIKGNTNKISRTLNYQSFLKDNKDNIFDNSSIYNGQSIESIKISAFEVKDTIDFSTFSDNITFYFKELDLKDIKSESYSVLKYDGMNKYNIFYDVKDKEVAIYLEYIVSNVVVVHNDITELNYTFKNLDLGAKNTLLRVIIPYQTQSELYKFWVHGPSNGVVQELVSSTKYKAGFMSEFKNLKENVNVRITLPLEQVSIGVYLNHSKLDAFSKVVEIEQKKIDDQKMTEKLYVILKWVIIGTGILYVLGSPGIYLYYSKYLAVIYVMLGLVLTIFNFIFKYHLIYLYFILLCPLIALYIRKRYQK